MTPHKIDLTLAVHNHQPVGNFDFIIEQNYRDSYAPFIQALEKHPRVRVALHYSGYLWDYIKSQHPDFLDRLHKMVERGQIEMLGGAYYEAILTVLPERDAVSQQSLLKKEMEEYSRHPVEGMWLAERIWEPSMPGIIRRGGYGYTFLDESHFHAAGIPSDGVWGIFRTEDRGDTTLIFPIDKALRYAIPFAAPEKTIDTLEKMRNSGRKLVTYGDDGEKFGSWPGTFKWVYQDGWLENFLTKLELNSFINILLPREAAEAHQPRRTVYLPCASYEEMGEWTLPAETQVDLHHLKEVLTCAGFKERVVPYLRGGFWRQFFAKYREAAALYQRSLRVSDKVAALKQKRKVDLEVVKQAEKCLYKGQANDAYWHGVFGGVYLPHLRSAVEKELILAETICGRELRKSDSTDKYNPQAVVWENAELRVQIQPNLGGGISALDIRKAGFNPVDTMARYREPYHTRMMEAAEKGQTANNEHASIHDRLVVKEEGLVQKLAQDAYPRYCFIDRFLKPEFSLDDLQYNRKVEAGDFAGAEYRRENNAENLISLSRKGSIADKPAALKKTFRAEPVKLGLKADYQLTGNLSGLKNYWFAPEFNLNLLAPCADDRFFLINGVKFAGNNLGGRGDRSDVKMFSLVDDWLGIRINLSASLPARWVWHPVETISLSEEGIERVYQGSAILPLFRIADIGKIPVTVELTLEYWKPVV